VLDLLEALTDCVLASDLADELCDEDSLPWEHELRWLLSPLARKNDGESLRFSIFTLKGGATT